ncbi:replication initiator, partial [Nocardioides guangzhouensis]
CSPSWTADLPTGCAARRGPHWPRPYAKLGDWVHMLGFRGHFGTKSRRSSMTLTALRRARRRAQALIAQHRADGRPLDLAALEADLLAHDHDETTLAIGHWTYTGTGWHTEAQAVLANAAAARARERDQWKAEQRRQHEAGVDREKGRR